MAKPYATSWTLGGSTRSPETLTIPTAGVLSPTEGTVECWVYVNDLIKNTAANRAIFNCRPSSGPENVIILRHTTSNTWYFVTTNASDQATTVSVADDLAVGWHYFAARWSATELALWIDAQKVGTASNPYLPSAVASIAYIGGSAYATDSQINTFIDDLRISSRARTDQEIADAYNSGQPLPADEYTTLKLDFDGPDFQRGAKAIVV